MPNCLQRHNKLLHSDFLEKDATTSAPDATTAVATMITQGGLPIVRIKLVNGNHNLSMLAMCDTGSSISFVDNSQFNRIYTSAAMQKSVFVSSRNSRITRCQDGNSADSCVSAREVSTIEDSAILCSRETEVERPNYRSARVEISLPKSEELAKSELQPKRSSSNSWKRLLQPIRIQKATR